MVSILAGVYLFLFSRFATRPIKFYVIESHIFGHLVLEYAEISSRIKLDSSNQWICFLEPSCNQLLRDYITKEFINRNFRIIESYKSLRLAVRLDQSFTYRFKRDRKLLKAESYVLTHRRASELSQSFNLPKFTSKEAESFLKNGKPSIAVINRSAEYQKYGESSQIYTHRNFEFGDFEETIIKNEDINFIRIGRYSSNFSHIEMTNKLENLIEFGGSLEANENLDLALMSNLEGYFGADTGPLWFFLLRSVPVAVVNAIPLAQSSTPDHKKMLVIPKLLWSSSESRFLTLRDMTSPAIYNLQFTHQFRSKGLEVIDNTQSDISEFFSEWRHASLKETDAYDIERMNWIRKVNSRPDLPSIGMGFLQRYRRELDI